MNKTLSIKKLLSSAMVCFAAVLLLTSSDKRPITVFMIGDSTMANKDISNGKKERGWGMALQCYFDDGIVVDNHAVNGRSSKSFIDEGRWQTVYEKIMPGDYVIIQFGHNDEKPKADRHTDPGSTFDANLKKFIEETREKGGIPILMNAVVRRNFFPQVPENDDDEKLRDKVMEKIPENEGDILYDTHGDYIVAPRNVAKETGCIFVDANKITHDLEQGLGKIESRKLHMWFLPGEEPSVPKGKEDNTHYNVYGAHVVAKLLADAMCKEVKTLKKHHINYNIAVDSKGKGDFLTLEEAVKAAPEGKKTTIQLFAGEYKTPEIPAGKKIKFHLREGAKWK